MEQAEQRLERAVSCAGEAFLIHFLGDILVSKSPDKKCCCKFKGKAQSGSAEKLCALEIQEKVVPDLPPIA